MEKNRVVPTVREAVNIILTFSVVMLSLILFRSPSVADAIDYLKMMVDPSLISIPDQLFQPRSFATLIFVFLLLSIEWLNRDKHYAITELGKGRSRKILWPIYYFLIYFLFFFSNRGQNFIYVQF